MLPRFLQPALWSYDIKLLDKEKHQKTILFGILNYGTYQMVQWMKKEYLQRSIIKFIEMSNKKSWNNKSLKYWKCIFKIN